MDGVIKRNRTMFRLSIIALVLYVICIGLTYLIMAMGFEAEQWMLFSSGILGEVALVAFLIGYVAVYVLWTPDNEGNVRKRPTWQFVLLLIAIFVPMIQGILYNYAGIEWGTTVFTITSQNSSGYISQEVSITDIFVPLKWVMMIILLIKCERKAKKIIIPYVVSSFLYVLYLVTDILLLKIGSRPEFLLMQISSILSLAIALVIFIFTIIYTRRKYKEASALKVQRGL